ncbi:Hypp178 [Branchiostoma lanceolatum]|uniref:Hypp178 protein n=1 Tax=Branchiostoma lanceolatum TaxID=7740 RepID=A0A8J9WBW1_BRALA|nr:Hypp178 [Branchiostoma lanceolatum]
MGKRKRSVARRPVFRRHVFDPEELDEISQTREEVAIVRTGNKINSGPYMYTYGSDSETNMDLLPDPGAHTYVPIHFVLLLSVFFLFIQLIFCRAGRSKPAAPVKSTPSWRRSSTSPTTSNNKVKRSVSVVDKDLLSLKGSSYTKGPGQRRQSVRRKSAV